MNIAATIERLEAEGFTTEQIVKVLKCIVVAEPVAHAIAVDEQAERRRLADRERQARKRERLRMSADVCGLSTIPPTPPINNITNNQVLEITPQPPKAGGSRLNGTNPRAVGTNPRASEQEPDGFDAFWAAYPKRDGNADRKGAVKAFAPAVKRAGDHSLVTRAAARYAAHCREKGKIGTEFVKQARSWLNGDFWREWLPQEPTKAAVSRVMVREGSPAWEAWKRTGRRFNAMDLKDDHGHVIGRGWYFETEFPQQEKAA